MSKAAELLRALDKAATAGPWRRSQTEWDGTPVDVVADASGAVVLQAQTEFHAYESGAFISPDEGGPNFDLIATTRNLLPLMAALVEAADRVARYFEPTDGGQGCLDEDGARLLKAMNALNAAAAKEVEK